jgi:hypothetical protein
LWVGRRVLRVGRGAVVLTCGAVFGGGDMCCLGWVQGAAVVGVGVRWRVLGVVDWGSAGGGVVFVCHFGVRIVDY